MYVAIPYGRANKLFNKKLHFGHNILYLYTKALLLVKFQYVNPVTSKNELKNEAPSVKLSSGASIYSY